MPKERGEIPVLRLEPEKRLCPVFELDDIADLSVEESEEMGFQVMDDFCEEHIQ